MMMIRTASCGRWTRGHAKRYLRFAQLTPGIFNTMDGTTHRATPDGYVPTAEHYVFCQQFVIECALQAAEVDHYLTPPPWIGS